MDIVRATLENDGHEELVEMIDKNDTRVIKAFSEYGVAFPDQVSALLDLEMGIQFKKDIDKIQEKHSDFSRVTAKIINNLADEAAEFDFDILDDILIFSSRCDPEISDELFRCLNFYTSFYMDNIEFNPYKDNDDKKASTEQDSKLTKIN